MGWGRKIDIAFHQMEVCFQKSLFSRFNFAACNALTISSQHKLCRVNKTYDNHRYVSCRFDLQNTTRVVGLESTSHTTSLYGVNPPNDLYLRFIVRQDPRKDRILHQIIVWAARQSVEVHQVLEVRYFTSLMRQTINKQSLGQKQKRWPTRAELIPIPLLQATIPLARTKYDLVIAVSKLNYRLTMYG